VTPALVVPSSVRDRMMRPPARNPVGAAQESIATVTGPYLQDVPGNEIKPREEPPHGKTARDLVERQAQAGMADQVGTRYARIRTEPEQCHQPLAPTFVGGPQNSHRDDGRMSRARTLNLLRMHVFAGCDDHAAGTAGEPEEAALVEHADVAD